jgi:GntR family transcriptional regulator
MSIKQIRKKAVAELLSIFSEKQRQTLSKESPTPLYFQLYQLLKNCILDGTFANGMQLPTEKQLSTEFGISRITAKRSLDELSEEGLVERHRGKGTHVIYKYKPQPVHAPLVGMLQEIESMARNSTAVVLDSDMLQPPQRIRDEFGLNTGETALYLARVRERDGLRFGYYTSWTIGVQLPKNPRIFEYTPRLAYFRENGLEITHVTQTLKAVGAQADAAEALGVEPGSPLLSLTRRSYNQANDEEHLMDYLQVLYHPDRFQYRMDLTIDD